MRNYIRQILLDSLDDEDIEERRRENELRLREEENQRREEEARNKRNYIFQEVIDRGQFNRGSVSPAGWWISVLVAMAVVSLILSAIFGN
ncbi:hypothetical protein UFOVP1244_76 [uncultured Caudovirales phage]|uniref:Uncharacterized protein n=1 Tax=uncultured Caudovirales phage TaxID=2100421 RepID=A0A6J5RED5_9CAUD|nr:hypothetical protein UFOVP1244_76 [uncultured Caudovirales phage]